MPFTSLVHTTMHTNKKKKTPLDGGKRSRKQQCKKMAQTRWQSSKEEQIGDVQECVLFIQGDVVSTSISNSVSSELQAGQDHAENDQQNDQEKDGFDARFYRCSRRHQQRHGAMFYGGAMFYRVWVPQGFAVSGDMPV